jgi:hypothetical protein
MREFKCDRCGRYESDNVVRDGRPGVELWEKYEDRPNDHSPKVNELYKQCEKLFHEWMKANDSLPGVGPRVHRSTDSGV